MLFANVTTPVPLFRRAPAEAGPAPLRVITAPAVPIVPHVAASLSNSNWPPAATLRPEVAVGRPVNVNRRVPSFTVVAPVYVFPTVVIDSLPAPSLVIPLAPLIPPVNVKAPDADVGAVLLTVTVSRS